MTAPEETAEDGPRREPGLPRLLGAYLAVVAAALAGRLWFEEWAAPATASVMLLLPLLLTRDRPGLLRLEPRKTALSLLEGLAAAAVLLPLFFAGVWLLERFNSETVTAGRLARAAVFQIALVAVPEELFFRGFLQRGLGALRPGRVRLLGAEVGWGLPAAAALFALAHLAAGAGPGALLVFFPGLVFGWLWARRRSLAGAVLLHAACNLSLEWVESGLF